MAASISLHCDRTWPHGTCAAQIITDATTLDQARTAARRAGWWTADHGDYCPGHGGSGGAYGTTVVRLQPDTEPDR